MDPKGIKMLGLTYFCNYTYSSQTATQYRGVPNIVAPAQHPHLTTQPHGTRIRNRFVKPGKMGGACLHILVQDPCQNSKQKMSRLCKFIYVLNAKLFLKHK